MAAVADGDSDAVERAIGPPRGRRLRLVAGRVVEASAHALRPAFEA